MNLPVVHILVLFLFCLVTVSYGFLLENSTPAGNTVKPLSMDLHYLSEQLRDEKQLRYNLAERVTALEQKTGSQQQDHKINQLEQYVLKLEGRVKFLEENQVVPVNETIDKFARLEIAKESGIYQQNFEELEKKYNALQQTHAKTMNALADFQKKVSAVEQLKSVNQTQMLQNVQQKVQSLESKTNMLVNNGNARGQDFLALYNKTISVERNAKHMIENVAKNLNDSSTVIESNIIKLEQLQNKSTTKLSGEVQTLNLQIHETDQRLNQTKISLTDNSRQVAVSACLQSSKTFSANEIIKFSNVKMSTGLSNVSAFISTGKFTCEYPGLYHITAMLATQSSQHLEVHIMKNNTIFNDMYDQYSKGLHTSTAATTLQLDTNDTVYIKAAGSFLLYSDWSCMSIAKIK